MIQVTRTCMFFALAAGAAFGQVGGPVLGFVPEGSSLRKISGIPAAGVVESAVSVGRDLALAEVSPSQALVLATASDTGELLMLTPGVNGVAQISGVSGASAGATRIVFSPSGTAAALWFSSTGHLQIVNGLSTTPTVRDVDASFLGANPGALAVSDDGSWAIGSWDQIYAFGPSGALNVLPVSGAAEALTFFHATKNVAVHTGRQVVIVSDIGGSAVPSVIWSNPAEAADANAQVAVGLAASFDNSRLTVTGSLGGVFTFALATGETAYTDCGCAPTGLAGMGGSLYRLTGAKTGTLRLYDANTNEVWLVPQAPAAADGGQQ